MVIYPDGFPTEVQVRTRWQHEWANFFERLADRVGRGIRYEEPPAVPASEQDDIANLINVVVEAADVIAAIEERIVAEPGWETAEISSTIARALAVFHEVLEDL